MPELSRFAGLLICMRFYDTQQHHKPHVHVFYGDYEASVGVDGELLSGSLPKKQYTLLEAWLMIHEEEVYAAWNHAVQGQHFQKISPLF